MPNAQSHGTRRGRETPTKQWHLLEVFIFNRGPETIAEKSLKDMKQFV